MSIVSSWLVSGSRITTVWVWWFQLLQKAKAEEGCKFKAKLGYRV